MQTAKLRPHANAVPAGAAQPCRSPLGVNDRVQDEEGLCDRRSRAP